jgi:hypothetical protein
MIKQNSENEAHKNRRTEEHNKDGYSTNIAIVIQMPSIPFHRQAAKYVYWMNKSYH